MFLFVFIYFLLCYQYVFAIGLILHSARIQKFRVFLECLGAVCLLTFLLLGLVWQNFSIKTNFREKQNIAKFANAELLVLETLEQ